MPDLLFELLTEEIPARMQVIAAEELKRLLEIAFEEANLKASRIETYVTPRRLVLAVAGLPVAQPGAAEERRGPRVGAPDQAIQGFLKSAGIGSIEQCEKRSTDKGEFYFAVIERPGRATVDVLAPILRQVIETFPWPKSMRFPAATFRWVRPINSALSLFDDDVLAFDLDQIPVGKETQGHRFLWKAPIGVRNFADYREKLRTARVILDRDERKKMIADGLAKAADKVGVQPKEDAALLEEVTGLVEWPVVLMGRIDPHFMELPAEVLTTSMRTHQKYFACLDDKGALAPHFLLVANMIADDGGKAIVAGNERVLRARLSDAKFFWDQDRKATLASRVSKLAERVFYEKLGSVGDKVERNRALARCVAEFVGQKLLPDGRANLAEFADRASLLAKADLTTAMVGEFPELQGIMGSYYAQHDQEQLSVVQAIREHYAPQGPSDRCPSAEVSICAALADKIDTLVGFFTLGERPTGSKDPYALRRAALGVIRIILENQIRIPLSVPFEVSGRMFERLLEGTQHAPPGLPPAVILPLLDFFADRLKVALRDKGVRHDLIAAVFALGHEDDLVRLLARVDALGAFLKTDDGANLLTAYRRASNIVRIEEKKDGVTYNGAPERELFQMKEEMALAMQLSGAVTKSIAALEREDFAGAMAVLAALRPTIDEFFNKVTVNTEDKALRANRLRLLAQIRDTLNRVADFSQIEG